MILAPFELHRPRSLEEALALTEELGDEADFIAGGTDLLQNYKNRLHPKDHLIALAGLEELRGISECRIGAMERLSTIQEHPLVRERFPGLAEAIGEVASPLVRNSATLGGNLLLETRCFYYNQSAFWRGARGSCLKAESDTCLVVPQSETCYAAYSGDLAPVLMTMGASVELASRRGRRSVALHEFYRGDGIEKNVLGRREILTAVEIPEEAARLRCGYRKLRLRGTLDYPEMGVAASVLLDAEGGVVRLRCATTGVEPVPGYRDFSAEHAGRRLEEVVEAVAAAMVQSTHPRKNTWLPVGYRKRMVGVFLLRLLHELRGGRTGTGD